MLKMSETLNKSDMLKIRVTKSKTDYRTVEGTVLESGRFIIKNITETKLEHEDHSKKFPELDLKMTVNEMGSYILTAPIYFDKIVGKSYAITEESISGYYLANIGVVPRPEPRMKFDRRRGFLVPNPKFVEEW